MIKKSTFLAVFIIIAVSCFSQNTSTATKAKCSPQTLKYISEFSKSGSTNFISSDYIVKNIAGKKYVSAMIKINAHFNIATFEKTGSKIGTKAGSIYTVQIPAEKVSSIMGMPGIDYLQLDEPVTATLDSALHDTRVDSVHMGINLPQIFSGKDVVIGIIDAGFDYSHPTLLDTSGTKLRLKKVWEQKSTGTPPSTYAYGNEISDSTAMYNDGSDVALFSHGAHVAGIAGGSGIGSVNNKFRGVAYESDLVFVGIKPDPDQWTSTGMTNIIDGINYIYEYAASVGKPAVVNLSWGCSMGPHDGSSLFSQALDQLTGEGKIFVCAAGNNGQNNIHLNKTFTSTDTLLKTVMGFSTYNTQKKTWLDVWGDAGNSYSAQVKLYSALVPGDSTGYILPDGNIHNLSLVSSTGDTCYVSITNTASDFNGKPRIFFDFYSKTTNKVQISIKGKSGTVNVWMGYVKDYTGYYGNFNTGGIPGCVTGNKDMTISDFASSHSAISVAAYASKIYYTNIDGAFNSYSSYVAEGNLTPFSSHGPSADSLTKPEIAAPGLTIASAINSYDSTYNTGGANRSEVMECYTSPANARNYCYAMMSGTSMASPMTSGIIALLLQATPNLTPNVVRYLLQSTAITDNFTGIIPAQGSNLWGYGKVNAYAALSKAINTAGLETSNAASAVMVFPNPNNGSFTINFSTKKIETITVEICDLMGKLLQSFSIQTEAGNNQKTIDCSTLPTGIFLLKISDSNSVSVAKIIRN